MDIKGFIKSKTRKKEAKLAADPLIRTMQSDIVSLRGGDKSVLGGRAGSPPPGLPIVESIKKSESEAQKQVQEKIRRTQEIAAQKQAENQKKIMEKIEREKAETQKRAQEKARKQAEMQRQEREEIEKQRIKAQKQAEERAREEAEKQKRQREKAIEKEQERARKEEKKRLKALKRKQGKSIPKLIAGLVVIFVIIGAGAFFYWWNYIRVIPPSIVHYECQNQQCIEVQGHGENQCQINKDCEPVEPIVPELLIPSAQTETIEILSEEYDLFFNQLKAIVETEQEANTFKSVLIKLTSESEKVYADFNTFVSASKISIPANINQAVAESENNGENYTFFLFSQEQANRLGLVISMGESSTLVQDLSAWEETIINDVKILFLESEIPESATEEFQDNIYKNIAIRYINFPTSDLSIDYAIVDNKLVITTSKDSMYAIIDTLISIESID